MNILKGSFLISLAAILLLTMSCSNSEDSSEKGVVRETQETIAKEAVNYIKDPLDQAKAVNKISNDRAQQIEEAQNQEQLKQ